MEVTLAQCVILTLEKNDRGMHPADCPEVYCTLASLEDFKGILSVLELSGVDAAAAPGRDRRDGVGLLRVTLRHAGRSLCW